MEMIIQVENIKCGGCANSIRKGLLENPNVHGVEVDVDNGRVTIGAGADAKRDDLVAQLLSMGYPETGSVEGLKAIKAKATSFVSCAVGRVTQETDGK